MSPMTRGERVLAQEYREVQTGVTDTLTLAYEPLRTLDDVGLEVVFVDGAFLPPTLYTIDGARITFTTPLAGTETVTIRYPYRS